MRGGGEKESIRLGWVNGGVNGRDLLPWIQVRVMSVAKKKKSHLSQFPLPLGSSSGSCGWQLTRFGFGGGCVLESWLADVGWAMDLFIAALGLGCVWAIAAYNRGIRSGRGNAIIKRVMG